MTDLRPRLATALGDGYRIEQELGGGGMSRVFLAEEVQLGRKVVVKVLPPELGAGVNAERFKREIQLAARLQHPHVVPLIAAGQDGELFWYTMPFIAGESLRSRLARENELPVGETVRLLRDVADALEYAHAQGVVHRDIKPDNVLISGHHAVVTDFGVAKAISASTGPSSLTSVGVALGTPAYMAPEQASADPNTDHRADIYALGVLAYEMLTGKPPFEGAPTAVLAAHVTRKPTPVTDQRGTVPPALATMVMKCLEKRPADRYQSSSELHALLDAMATPSGGTQPTSAVPATASAAKLTGLSWLRFAAITAVIAVVTVVGTNIVRGRQGGRVLRQASRMAIMPFGSPTPDSALAVLGRNLVVLISASLDGVGEIKMVEPTTVLARTTAPPSLDEAFGHARTLGAASLVYGTLVPLGRDVRLDAAVYDAETREVIARAAANGPLANMAQLADSAAWSLLTAVWRARGAPTVSDAALTGRPLAAVREFVDGERALAMSLWADAAAHYSRAIEADSTFWLAYRRFAWSREWALESVPGSVTQAYRDHRAELPARERDLINALLVTALGPRTDSLRAVSSRYPDFWPAWLSYADVLFHNAAVVGARPEEIVAPWEHLREILPSFRPTYEHLVVARAHVGDSAGVFKALEEWRAIGGEGAYVGSVDIFLTFGGGARLRATEPAADSLLIDSLVRTMAERPATFAALAGSMLGEVAFSRELAASAKRTRLTGDVASHLRRLTALSLVQRGDWTSGLDSLARLGGAAGIEAYEYEAIGLMLNGVDPSATPRRSVAPESADSLARLRMAWADGMAAYARRDRVGLAAARRAAGETRTRRIAYVQAALDILSRDLDGSRAGATDALLVLERAYADSSTVTPVAMLPVLRIVLARWLLAAGRATDASWALQAFDARPSSGPLASALSTMGIVAAYHRGVAAEALGERDRARRFHQRFLNGYDLAPPHHRAWLDSARAGLARMRQ